MTDNSNRRDSWELEDERDYERRGFDSDAYGRGGYADEDFEFESYSGRGNPGFEDDERYGSGAYEGHWDRQRGINRGVYSRNRGGEEFGNMTWRGRRGYGGRYGEFERDYDQSVGGYNQYAGSRNLGRRGGNLGAPRGYGPMQAAGGRRYGRMQGRFRGFDPDYDSMANYGDETWYGRDRGMRGRGWDADYEEGPFVGKGPRGYQRADERILEDANEALTQHGWLDASDIEASVSGGIVTLEGTVDSRRSKRMAEDAVEHLRGVIDVQNNLRIRRQGEEQRQSQSTKGRRGRKPRQSGTDESTV